MKNIIEFLELLICFLLILAVITVLLRAAL